MVYVYICNWTRHLLIHFRSALRFWLLGLESHIEISGVESLMCGFCSAETTSAELSCPSPTVMSWESEEVASWLFLKSSVCRAATFMWFGARVWLGAFVSLSSTTPSAAATCQLGIGKKVKFDSLYLAYFLSGSSSWENPKSSQLYFRLLVLFLSNPGKAVNVSEPQFPHLGNGCIGPSKRFSTGCPQYGWNLKSCVVAFS